jgi:hypothetical protein
MARPRKRLRLEDGVKLDVNKLVRQGFWPRGNEPLTFSTNGPQIIAASSRMRKARSSQFRCSGSHRFSLLTERSTYR